MITSNRESGFGRYYIMRMPKDVKEDAIIIEFRFMMLKRRKVFSIL